MNTLTVLFDQKHYKEFYINTFVPKCNTPAHSVNNCYLIIWGCSSKVTAHRKQRFILKHESSTAVSEYVTVSERLRECTGNYFSQEISYGRFAKEISSAFMGM
jgi:hypothetical protein